MLMLISDWQLLRGVIRVSSLSILSWDALVLVDQKLGIHLKVSGLGSDILVSQWGETGMRTATGDSGFWVLGFGFWVVAEFGREVRCPLRIGFRFLAGWGGDGSVHSIGTGREAGGIHYFLFYYYFHSSRWFGWGRAKWKLNGENESVLWPIFSFLCCSFVCFSVLFWADMLFGCWFCTLVFTFLWLDLTWGKGERLVMGFYLWILHLKKTRMLQTFPFSFSLVPVWIHSFVWAGRFKRSTWPQLWIDLKWS